MSSSLNSAPSGSTNVSCNRKLKPAGTSFCTVWFHSPAQGKTGGAKFCNVSKRTLSPVRNSESLLTHAPSDFNPVQSSQ